MTTPETPVQLAARQVAEAEMRVVRQKQAVEELRRRGCSEAASTAEGLLRSFEIALALARSHLRKELEMQGG